MKKTLVSLVALVCCLFSLPVKATAPKTYTIGIAQFAVHGSLDNCREGFLQGLKESGFEEGLNLRVEIQNAQADMGTAAAVANSLVSMQADLICAIATPMAKVCMAAADGKIPVVYSAVSDPVAAGLANADKSSIGNTTGTSDELPVKGQLELIRAIQPEAKVIGILYTTSEVNSQVQVKEYERLAPEFGFSIKSSAVTTGADIALALPSFLKQVDCVSMVLDNTVVQYLDVVLDKAGEKKIPVYGSEIEQVKKGCVATVGIDYIALGKQTGLIAARILKGEKSESIPFENIKESSRFYNSKAMAALSLNLSDSLKQTMADVAQ